MLGILAGCNVAPPDTEVVDNHPPAADAGPDQNVDTGQRVTLTALASTDPDDDLLTYFWQQRSGPSVILENPSDAQAGFVPTEQGTYEFAMTVTDGRGGSDESTTHVFVRAAPPPLEPSDDAMPDFSLADVNADSSRYQEIVSPRDYLGQVSAWYFGDAL